MSSNDDDPALDPLFAAIGRFSAAWAHAEFGLDGILRTIHEGRVTPRPDDEFPVSFKNKVRYFRATIQADPCDPVRSDYTNLCQELMNRSEMRSRIIHGFLVEIDQGGKRGKFGHFNVSDPTGLPKEHSYTIKQIMTETVSVRQLRLGCGRCARSVLRVGPVGQVVSGRAPPLRKEATSPALVLRR